MKGQMLCDKCVITSKLDQIVFADANFSFDTAEKF